MLRGKTRLQKFGILSFYEVLDAKEFFDDWRPDNYGGFSPRLAASLGKLERHDYARSDEIITKHGYPVNRYVLTEEGKNLIRDFVERHSSKLEEIKSIISSYFQLSLPLLLKDVYQKYPKLTVNSKIRADINKITESRSYQNHEYEMFPNEKIDVSTPFIASRQHVFGDEDFREKLARSIGLKKIPDLNPRSFDRIKGILSENIDTEYFDSEELVKDVRGC